MNLIEAIKSGRPFRRKEWESFAVEIKERSYYEGGRSFDLILANPSFSVETTLEDLLADDWETQEPTVTGEP